MVQTREEKLEYVRRWRARKRAQGLCIDCGSESAAPDRVRCPDCGAKMVEAQRRHRAGLDPEDRRVRARETKRRWRERKHAEGLCVCCGRLPQKPGRRCCPACLAGTRRAA